MSTESEIYERFQREAADHQMTVMHDDGLYRHLRWAQPRNELYRFDLITWPHGLLIRGDGPNFVFSVYPTKDLFDLFRQTSHSGINPGYWQEKVVAGQVHSWSEDLFRDWLGKKATVDEVQFPGLTQAVHEWFFHGDEFSTEYEETARHAVAQFSHGSYQLRFPEPWEQSFEDFDWSFLWACHAIVWGIAKYDAHKAGPESAGVETVASL